MAALRSLTKDAPYLVTQTTDEGERSRRIDYLLPSGARRRVTIDQAHDSPQIQAAIGDALAQGRTGLTKGRKHGT